jgi:hypothetical protein
MPTIGRAPFLLLLAIGVLPFMVLAAVMWNAGVFPRVSSDGGGNPDELPVLTAPGDDFPAIADDPDRRRILRMAREGDAGAVLLLSILDEPAGFDGRRAR